MSFQNFSFLSWSIINKFSSPLNKISHSKKKEHLSFLDTVISDNTGEHPTEQE